MIEHYYDPAQSDPKKPLRVRKRARVARIDYGRYATRRSPSTPATTIKAASAEQQQQQPGSLLEAFVAVFQGNTIDGKKEPAPAPRPQPAHHTHSAGMNIILKLPSPSPQKPAVTLESVRTKIAALEESLQELLDDLDYHLELAYGPAHSKKVDRYFKPKIEKVQGKLDALRTQYARLRDALPPDPVRDNTARRLLNW